MLQTLIHINKLYSAMTTLVDLLKQHQKKGNFERNFGIYTFGCILTEIDKLPFSKKEKHQKYIKMLKNLDMTMFKPELTRNDINYLGRKMNWIIKNVDVPIEKEATVPIENKIISPEKFFEEVTDMIEDSVEMQSCKDPGEIKKKQILIVKSLPISPQISVPDRSSVLEKRKSIENNINNEFRKTQMSSENKHDKIVTEKQFVLLPRKEFLVDDNTIKKKYGENYISKQDLGELNSEMRQTIREIIVNLKELFGQQMMDSALNNVIESYLLLSKNFPKLSIFKLIMDIVERHGWDVNNFIMPPDRVGLINDLDQVLEQIALY